jgi:hypothetical protein
MFQYFGVDPAELLRKRQGQVPAEPRGLTGGSAHAREVV